MMLDSKKGSVLGFSAEGLKTDIEDNWGLPLAFYKGEEAMNLDLRAIYKKSWLYFCPATEVTEPGNSVVGHCGDIPVVVIRGDDGILRGFVNMCRHRGFKVAAKNQKNCSRFVCRYHAWSYHPNGELAYAPGCEDEEGFPKEDLGLKPIKVEQWGPAIFVHADADAPSFLESHPGLAEEAEEINLDLSMDEFVHQETRTHDVDANWKVWYDNFVECYHCDYIHKGSFAAAYEGSPLAARNELFGTFMSNIFAAKEGKSKTELRADNYRSISIYPGSLILQQKDLMILSQMRPIGPEKAEQRVDYFAQKGSDPELVQQWIDLWEQTFDEDGVAVTIQQAGLRTGALERNRLLPNREKAVAFFNTLTIDAYIADEKSS